VVAIAAGLVVLYLGLTISGYDGLSAITAMYRGGLGSKDAVVSAMLPRAIPLILIGLGIGVSFRAGALNIGAEGQFYAGAIAATAAALSLGGWPRLLAVPTVLGAGLLAGALWAGVPTLLRLRFGVLEVISTLLLNFVAEALVSWMVQGPLQESTHIYPQSDPVPLAARLPVLPGARLHLGLAVALVLAGALWPASGRWLASSSGRREKILWPRGSSGGWTLGASSPSGCSDRGRWLAWLGPGRYPGRRSPSFKISLRAMASQPLRWPSSHAWIRLPRCSRACSSPP
jgi:Branched-chain amino acid transport system / permease component